MANRVGWCLSLIFLVSAGALSGPLEDLLAFIPVQVASPVVSFTNWARIRLDEGLDQLTGQSPLEERWALVRSTVDRQAAPSAFGSTRLDVHAEIWGWDIADHVWEANLTLESFPPLRVIKLAEWVDLEALAGRFRDRGFSEEALLEAVVFRHPLDLTANWIRATEFAILNTAILFEERTLVMCSSPGGVEAVLAARAGELGTWADVSWAVSLARLLDRASGAVVLLGPSTCLGFSGGEILNALLASPPGEAARRLKMLLEEGPPLQPYVGLAAGYEVEDGEPVGLFVLQYLDEETAHADLPTRRALAENGVSVVTRAPYREGVFTVREATVEETSVVLRVDPANGRPSRILHMVYARDLVFALCP